MLADNSSTSLWVVKKDFCLFVGKDIDVKIKLSYTRNSENTVSISHPKELYYNRRTTLKEEDENILINREGVMCGINR